MKVYKDNRGSHDLEAKIERLQIKIRELEAINERLVEENSNFLNCYPPPKRVQRNYSSWLLSCLPMGFPDI